MTQLNLKNERPALKWIEIESNMLVGVNIIGAAVINCIRNTNISPNEGSWVLSLIFRTGTVNLRTMYSVRGFLNFS